MVEVPESRIGSTASRGSRGALFLQKAGSMSLGRLLTACLFIGIGIGSSLVGVSIAAKWYTRRPAKPIPPKIWPPVSLSFGATATLQTDWNGEARYQLRISPAGAEVAPAFKRIARLTELRPWKRQFRVHFLDKAGFEVCSDHLEGAPDQDSIDRAAALIGNGHFNCERADYNRADRWSLDYRFPSLLAEAPPENASRTNSGQAKTVSRAPAAITPQAGDDVLTGFDLSTGHLEVRSGKTFLIYREGERSTALGWQTWAEVTLKQPGLHYECSARNECLVENEQTKEAVHARLLR